MGSVLKLEEIILSLLVPMDGQKPANPGLEKQLIADTKRHRYQVIVQGWEKSGEHLVELSSP